MLVVLCYGPSAAEARLRVGININQAVADSELTRMQMGGASLVRFPINWNFIEPRVDHYVWDFYDYAFAALANRRMTYFPVIQGLPAYIDHTYAEYPAGIAQLTRFRYFMQQLISRYGHGGSFWQEHPELPEMAPPAWQIWNEPNLPGNSPGLKPSPSTYSYVLKIAAEEIHARDPVTQVVVGGMSPSADFGALDYLDQLWKIPGTRAATDAIALHTYPRKPKQLTELLDFVGDFMESHFASQMPVWITEFGWSTAGEKVPQRKNRGAQARALKKAVEIMRRQRHLNLVGALWYSWRDMGRPGASNAWQPYTGLFNYDGLAKPSWRAFTRLTGGRGGSTVEGALPPVLAGPSFPAGPYQGFFPSG
ncbi:MAG: polysaccharide biosynthesis protein PslG [Thermoleophilaceae bacterium]|nr:polysaccharide biosynthesis protein PslG [Thermoleophilaceae bacterium]